MKNSKLVIFLSCLFAATFNAPLVTAAARGGGHGSGGHSFAGRPGMGMPGRPGMGMSGRFGMGMPGRPGMGMRSGFNRQDRFDRDRFDRDRFHQDNDFIFIGDFGFPWWWGWGWGPWWGYPYGYGYGYGYGGYGYGNGYGYGYGYSSRSRVAELQQRLARAGYYMAPLTASWDLTHVEQCALTNVTTICTRTVQSIRGFSLRTGISRNCSEV